MSKTERDLTAAEAGDALDELFAEESFDSAFDGADQRHDEQGVNGSSSNAVADLDDEVDAVDGLDSGTADLAESSPAPPVSADTATSNDAVARIPGEPLAPSATPVAAGTPTTTVRTEPRPVDEASPSVDASPASGVVAPNLDDESTPVNRERVDDPDALAPDSDDDPTVPVSDKILEELRQAEIDGPVVAFAPQDDTTTARRRPKRAADYDPAPVPIPAKVPRVLGRKARVRKVTRVVRHVDPWSVFKIAIVAHLVLYVIVLTASVLLWNVAYATGTVDNVERFFESFGWNSFEFNGGELYHAGWIAGLFVVIGLTGLAVLAATLFNLITDLVGGVRFTVLEEEVVETRTSPMRRFVMRRPEPEVPAVVRDGSGAMYREAVVDDSGAIQRPTR